MKKWLIRIGAFLLLVVLASFVMAAVAQTETAAASEMSSSGIFAVQMESAHFAIDWSVIGAGGGEMSSAHYSLNSTIGQPATGNSSSTNFAHHAGYWQNWFFKIFLPLIQIDF